MSKLTKEFVEGFLERYDGDLSGSILDLADGGNPLHALLEGLDRKDIIKWLQEEFDGLLMHGFEPAQDIDLPERKNSELLLAFLEKTKPENSRGLQFEIEAVGDPEEGYTPEKYIQAYEVSIRYEGTELGTCALESEGAYVSGKWVAESAQWPTLLQGVVPLPTVVIQEPQHQRQEVDRIEKLETGLSKPIKEYDRIVDGRPDARKQLEQTNPGLVAARDQAVVKEKRHRIQQELAARSARQSNSRRR